MHFGFNFLNDSVMYQKLSQDICFFLVFYWNETIVMRNFGISAMVSGNTTDLNPSIP